MFDVFSTPAEGNFLALAEHLSCRLFRSTVWGVRAMAERVGAPPPRIDAEAATPERVSTRLWSPAVGHVLRGLGERTADHWPWISAQLAVVAFTNGLVDDLAFELSGAANRWLTVAGRSLRGDRLRFDGHAGRLVVTNHAGQPVLELQRTDLGDDDPVWTRDGVDDLVCIGSAGTAVLGGGEHIDQYDPPDYEVVPVTPAFRAQLEEAATLLEECLPATYVWIAAVLREVGTFAAPPVNGTRSGSSVKSPGHVRMSVGASLVETINMLVHECCHQYFYLASSGAGIVRRGAPELYSVLKETARPFDLILLGFHAFGNVLLVHDALLDGRHPVDRREVEHERTRTRDLVAGLEASLHGHWETHLEDAGRDLYLPLRQRLVAAGHLAGARR
jgi:HEXXH motif-containing protein